MSHSELSLTQLAEQIEDENIGEIIRTWSEIVSQALGGHDLHFPQETTAALGHSLQVFLDKKTLAEQQQTPDAQVLSVAYQLYLTEMTQVLPQVVLNYTTK